MLEIKNIHFSYGKSKVLSDLSVSFEKGKFIAVTGPNGSGKSTLLKTALNINKAEKGDIILNGTSLLSHKRQEISQNISYLSQGRNTPDMTVYQMVLHGRFPYLKYPRKYSETDRKTALSAMKETGVLHLKDSPLANLSGGMRQRAYLAMILCQDTDYIFLDEPTTYLDITYGIELMRLLKNLTEKGKCVVAVMHDLPLAFNFCDEIVVMDEGRILYKDIPSKLYSKDIIKNVFSVGLCRSDEGKYYYDI